MLGLNPSLSRENVCQRFGLWQQCVSAFSSDFDVGFFFLTQYVEVTQLDSGFLSHRNVSGIAVDSMYL